MKPLQPKSALPLPATKVFISYSHENRPFKDKLLKFLRPLIHAKRIDTWDDQRVAPGEKTEPALMRALDEAAVAVIILTADYLASPNCASVQMEKILMAQRQRGLWVVPILWSACYLDAYPSIAGLQLLPRDGKPVDRSASKSHQAQILTDIAKAIDGLLASNKHTSHTIGERYPDTKQSYVIELEPITSTVDVLELVHRLQEQQPHLTLWRGNAFKSLIPGRGDKMTPQRVLTISWYPDQMTMEMNPHGFTEGHPLPKTTDHLVRPATGEAVRTYRYYPMGNAQPHCYEVRVRFGSSIIVNITDISPILPDLDGPSTFMLRWSGSH